MNSVSFLNSYCFMWIDNVRLGIHRAYRSTMLYSILFGIRSKLPTLSRTHETGSGWNFQRYPRAHPKVVRERRVSIISSVQQISNVLPVNLERIKFVIERAIKIAQKKKR